MSFIAELLKVDKEDKILTVVFFGPYEEERTGDKKERPVRLTGKAPLEWYIRQEWRAEAGNMAVSGGYSRYL